MAVLSVQFLGYVGLGLLCLAILIFSPSACRPWLDYVRRARRLLFMLWIILAYNTPGEAFRDFSWAPTYEGLAAANLHAVRLMVMRACLAWLFARLDHAALLSALWGLLLPLRKLGFDIERLLVRLSLVLENLKSPPKKGAWKQMLAAQPDFTQGSCTMPLAQPAWHWLDAIAIFFITLLFSGALFI